MVSYPCPFCGAPAGLESGCGGCGRPPFPDAAEVVRLNGRTIELYAEVESARARYGTAVQRFNATMSQRNMLAARVKAAVAAARPISTPTGLASAVSGAAGHPAPVGDRLTGANGAAQEVAGGLERRPEAAPRTVQNVLFILGGLLLGSAAIVFAAVAWASFGVFGRAAILAVVTLLVLAVPPVALARGLRATGETFAALGVLLVLLDGYAAWYVDLAGLAGATMPSTYAGLVCAITAGVAGGYAALTRLRAPRLAAVVAVQPVLPLLALHRGFGPTGWTLVFVAVAAIGVLLGRTVEQMAWIPAGLSVLSALPPALHALATVDGVPAATRDAGVMVLLAAVVAVAALAHERTVPAGFGAAIGIVTLGAMRLAAEVFPAQRYAAFAAVLLLVAAAATIAPQKVRSGVRVGALVMVGGFALPYAYFAVLAAAQSVRRALPAWHTDGRPGAAGADGGWWAHRLFDWQEPVALVLLAAALWLLLRHRSVPWTAAALVAFAVPAAVPNPPVALASIVDGALLLALVVFALRSDRFATLAIPFVATHLALTGLATPWTTVAVYGGLSALSTVVAARAAERRLGLPAAVVSLLGLPVTAAAADHILRIGTPLSPALPPALIGATVGLVAVTAIALVLHNRAHNAGTIATATAGAGVTVAATVQSASAGGATWFGAYAAVALLATWLAARGFRIPITAGTDQTAARLGHAVAAVVPGVLVVVSLVPAVAEVLLRPLGWLGAVWQGAPVGVGLGPGGTEWWGTTPAAFGPAAAAAGLGVLAVLAVLVARRVGAGVWSFAGPVVSLAIMLGCVAAAAPWPVVPALSLAFGLATGLGAALRRASAGAVFGGVACWFGIGSGLAGLLATRAATLAGLGALVAAAVVAGIAGRTAGARMVAWPVAAAGGAWLAFAAARAADLPLRAAAYWVLLAAAAILAAGWVLRDRRLPGRAARAGGAEGLVLDAVAHAVAVVAVLLTVGDAAAAAGVVGLWGVALGLRALAGAGRVGYAVAAIGAELLAYELVLVGGGVAVTEAYTVPAGAVAVGIGWYASRRNPRLTSWTAFGAGLIAGFGPSLALVLVTPGEPWRRLVLGAVAVAVVLAGARLRLKALVTTGGAVLVVLALHEVWTVWDHLPRWVPLAVAGLVLVGLAVTYERRLRDLGRLRTAMGRMR
ncbi:SCO7613 C-terminal domain-containing membrane protein [Dactylosporangium sp. CA-092794]|uniref:SCO7613 C-terminal domain-containing membrane protein n=1 Tax=Dactylosporangium sp. CA-092794 TaxID=3239929 RepID=UPI003D8B736F